MACVHAPPLGCSAVLMATTSSHDRDSIFRQYSAAVAANLSALAAGTVLGWSSPALARMSLSEAEKSWAGSLVALGAALGPWVGGWAADRLGRRATLLWGALPYLLGWAMLMATENLLGLLYAARVVLGVAVGISFTALPMYIGEISQPTIRGALGSLLQLSVTTGALLSFATGPFVPYVALASLGAFTAAIFAAVFCFRPESPQHLLRCGRDQEAKEALHTLRADSHDVAGEIQEMQATIESEVESRASFRDLVATRGNKRALMLSLGLVTLQQLSGINAVLFFGEEIFRKAGAGLDGSVSQMIVGVVMVAASCVTPLLVDRLGRRLLLVVSATGMCVAQVSLAVYFQLSAAAVDVSHIRWLPVTSLVVYMIFYSPGYGALPWAIMGELFPAAVKSVSSSLTASASWLLAFLVTKFVGDVATATGESAPHFAFGACCVLAALFVFFLLPETKGRTLDQIQDILNRP